MAPLPIRIFSLALVIPIAFLWVRRRARLAKLPPGPPRHLWRDHSQDVGLRPWKTFKAWNDKYGPVISIGLGRKTVIVLGTADVAIDLLEKRGEIYSSRPPTILANILTGGMRGLDMEYGPRWRRWRSLMTSSMSVQASTQYKLLQTIESSLLLNDLLKNENPTRIHDLLLRFTVSIVFCIAYGRRIKSMKVPVVVANQNADECFLNTPGRYLVESWPILLWLPRPLQWFRYQLDRYHVRHTQQYISVMNDVKERMQHGNAQPSMATHGLQKQGELGLSDAELAYALSAPWMAGVATTLNTIEFAFLAMLHHPEAMRKAQDELDAVVGWGRLPTFEDQSSLPFFNAFLKETMRWRPIGPIGFPHSVTEDDFYNGMFIPKGSTVYANVHGIFSDPELFPEPETFKPERFLDVTDPRLVNFKIPFGFGRRICPGMYVALQSLYIALTRIIWAFDVLPILEDGVEYIPSADDLAMGLVVWPGNLKYRLVPRNRAVEELTITEAERASEEIEAWR